MITIDFKLIPVAYTLSELGRWINWGLVGPDTERASRDVQAINEGKGYIGFVETETEGLKYLAARAYVARRGVHAVLFKPETSRNFCAVSYPAVYIRWDVHSQVFSFVTGIALENLPHLSDLVEEKKGNENG